MLLPCDIRRHNKHWAKIAIFSTVHVYLGPMFAVTPLKFNR